MILFRHRRGLFLRWGTGFSFEVFRAEGFDNFCGNAECHGVGWDAFGDDGAGPDNGVFADGYSREDHCVSSDVAKFL